MGQIDPKHTFPVGQERVVRNAAHAPGAGVRRARFQARLFRISGGLACEQSQKVGGWPASPPAPTAEGKLA
jgi:hypothetical protein